MPTTTTGKASSFITFSRGSLATVTDADGRIKWAPHNLLLASEQFDASSWTKESGVTVTANAVAAPNGTTTADQVDFSTGNIGIYQSVSVLASTNYSYGIWIRGDASGTINIGPASGGSTSAVNITTSWQYFTGTINTASTSNGPYIRRVSGDLGRVYLWGASLTRSDLGGMAANASSYPMYNPSTPRNLLGWSEAFDNAAWGKTSCSITSNATAAPNGSLSADQVIEVLDTSNNLYNDPAYNNTASLTLTGSVYLKYNTRRYVQFVVGSAANNFGVVVDLVNRVITATGTTSTSTYLSSSIQLLDNNWVRVAVTGTLSASNIGFLALRSSDASTWPVSGLPVITGAKSYYVWGAQLSDSASLDPYVGSYGAAPSAAAAHGPRLDYDPVTLAARGLLVEETRTNLFLRSAELSNGAVWVPVVGATVAANTVTAPDGTLTGDTITFSTTNGNRIEQVSGTAVSGETVTFSLWMKGSGTINLNVATDTGVGGSTESKITLTSSWTRYSVTTTYNASVTGVRRGMIIWRTGDTAVNVDVWGAQLEAGSFATSYIPTAASTVTRNADVASVATSQFPYSASEGTIVVSTLLTPKPGASLGIYAFDDGTTNNAFPSFYSNLVLATSRSGGSNIFIAQSAALPASEAVFKQAFAYKNADYAASFNGGSPTTQASGAVPSGINRVQLGAYNTQYLNGHIRQITYIPRRLSNAELQSRTA